MTSLARQTPLGARSSREQCSRRLTKKSPALPRVGSARYRLPGRLLEEPSNRFPREMAITHRFGGGNRTRLTGPVRTYSFGII